MSAARRSQPWRGASSRCRCGGAHRSEASVRPAWGRVYGVVGFLLAGFYAEGLDRGMAQGAHGGVGADFYSGRAMWNLNARLLWLQRNSGENVFGVQVGASVSPKLGGNRRQ